MFIDESRQGSVVMWGGLADQSTVPVVCQLVRSGPMDASKFQSQVKAFTQDYTSRTTGPAKWQRMADFVIEAYGSFTAELEQRLRKELQEKCNKVEGTAVSAKHVIVVFAKLLVFHACFWLLVSCVQTCCCFARFKRLSMFLLHVLCSFALGTAKGAPP